MTPTINDAAPDTQRKLSPVLPEQVRERYQSQIDYLEHCTEEGTQRFLQCREACVLLIGSGTMLTALVKACIESGLTRLHLGIIMEAEVERERSALNEALQRTRTIDPSAVIRVFEIHKPEWEDWKIDMTVYRGVIYGESYESIPRLRSVMQICLSHHLLLIPVIWSRGMGIAGPFLHEKASFNWFSTMSRVHQSACGYASDGMLTNETAALIANVAVFGLTHILTGVQPLEPIAKYYLLRQETMEGQWHTIHPFLQELEKININPIPWLKTDLEHEAPHRSESVSFGQLFDYCEKHTSSINGLFHRWEEDTLSQLPLSQCMVETVDPLSLGPVKQLSKQICCGFTHEEARREAAFSGFEMLTTRMIEEASPEANGSAGAGISRVEALFRGLQKELQQLLIQSMGRQIFIERVTMDSITDKACRFYYQSIIAMQGEPVIGLERNRLGLPVIWIQEKPGWYGTMGLRLAQALHDALKQTLQRIQLKQHDTDDRAEQNNDSYHTPGSCIVGGEHVYAIGQFNISSGTTLDESENHRLHTAIHTLEQHHVSVRTAELSAMERSAEMPIKLAWVQLQKEEEEYA